MDNKYRMYLGETHLLVHSPTHWKNFIRSIQDTHPELDDSKPIMIEKLKEYNAIFENAVTGIGRNCVVFDTEADATAFILRWS